MLPWIRYFIERLNPLIALPVIIGVALSGTMLNKNLFQPIPFMISSMLIFYIAFLLRLKNDLDDYERDVIAFPNRALPRGLLSKQTVSKTVNVLDYGLVVFFLFLLIFGWNNTRIAVILTAVYFWLMRHDFYAKDWLTRRPLIHGIAQQFFFFLVAILVISIGRPSLAFSTKGLAYALTIFASLYTYEICRKLDPYSHPVSMNYVHFYGFKKTFWLTCILLLLSGLGAYKLGLQLWLWPIEAVVFIALYKLFKFPKRFRVALLAASLSLILHAWAGPLQQIT